MDHDPVSRSETIGDVSRQQSHLQRLGYVQVWYLGPQRSSAGIGFHPRHIVWVPVLQLVTLVESDDHIGVPCSLQRGRRVRPDHVIAAEPEAAGDTIDGHFIEAAVH